MHNWFKRDADYFYQKGKKCLSKNSHKALLLFQKSTGLSPHDGMLHFNIAEIIVKETEQQPELRGAAIEYLTKTINLIERSHPMMDLAHLMRGNILVRFDRMQEALSDYNEAANLRPENVEVYYRRGLAYKKLGDFQKAKADLLKADSLARDSPLSIFIEAALNQL